MNFSTQRCGKSFFFLSILIFSKLSHAQIDPNQTPEIGPETKFQGHQTQNNQYPEINNQKNGIFESSDNADIQLISDQKTFIEGDFYLKNEIGTKDTEPKFMIVEPDGKVSSVNKSFIIGQLYGQGGCADIGKIYESPIWHSVPYSSNYGYLITGNDCPARVGIGVENPSTQLHVNGGGYFTSTFGVGSAPMPTTQMNVNTGRRNGISVNHEYASDFGYAYKALVHRKNTKGIGIINHNYDHDVFTVWGSGEIEASNAEGTFFNVKPEGNLEVSNAEGNILNLQPDGKFTISNGTSKLMQVETDGLLRARKVRIDMDDWADYVFNKDYELMPLNKLDRYINEHQHLPNVPSISSVIDEGIDLGDMNRVLLEKIEELTLYLIEQNKELEYLKKKINRLQKQVCE